MEKILIGISSCLLGNKIRYDGNHKHDRYITDTLGQFFDFCAVCPEVECGLGVPREAMRLVDKGDELRLLTINTKIDHTEQMQRWYGRKLVELSSMNLAGFIFKSQSPSSGMTDVKIFADRGTVKTKGAGLFAGAFMQRFPLIPVIDEGRLHDPTLRENFIELVFIYRRWLNLLESKPKTAALVTFHANHKYLIMSHDPAGVARLGALVAACRGKPTTVELATYGNLLMQILGKQTTKRKHTNVLQHLAGYFKKQLSAAERQELQEVIASFHQGLVPLIVPVTLIKHYARLYRQSYLATQLYLNPHPLELMLRNHV